MIPTAKRTGWGLTSALAFRLLPPGRAPLPSAYLADRPTDGEVGGPEEATSCMSAK